MAGVLSDAFAANPAALLIAAALDLALGDPVYRAHPVRLIGRMLAALEAGLRRIGADGYGGGIVLFVLLAGVSVGVSIGMVTLAYAVSTPVGWIVHVFLAYSLLALGDLLHHVWAVERALASGDLAAGRSAIARLVGRDTGVMDAAACRRAAVESLSESLTDGFTSAVFWYVLGGLPGLVLFKVVSTMDSMVGYKTDRYLRFGWCGARLDDAMNYVPARLTWLAIALVAVVLPRCSGVKAFRIGLAQHAVVPGPNSGWSEAASAGALERRLVGPIWMGGRLVTDVWIGDPSDPELGTRDDLVRAMRLVIVVGLFTIALAGGVIYLWSARTIS